MKLETLRSAWQAKNPGGNVWIAESNGELSESGKQSGKFAVTYKSDGKIYTYTYKSVYKLAERLNMIPGNNFDYVTESHKAILAMNNGESFVSICGLHDTIRYLLGNNDKDKKTVIINAETIDKDEWDRQQYKFISYEIFNSWEEYEQSKK